MFVCQDRFRVSSCVLHLCLPPVALPLPALLSSGKFCSCFVLFYCSNDFIIISSDITESVKGLKIIHPNIRSLVSKIDFLHAWVTLYKPNIITISETWLHSNIMKLKLIILFCTELIGPLEEVGWPHMLLQILFPSVLHTTYCTYILLHDNKHLTISNIYCIGPHLLQVTLQWIFCLPSILSRNTMKW